MSSMDSIYVASSLNALYNYALGLLKALLRLRIGFGLYLQIFGSIIAVPHLTGLLEALSFLIDDLPFLEGVFVFLGQAIPGA